MVTSSSKTRSSGPVLRSRSPGGRFCSSPSLTSSSSAFASSTSSSFYSSSSTFYHDDHRDFRNPNNLQPRSTSPNRVNLYSASPSVRFVIDHRSISPNRSAIVSRKNRPVSSTKKTCMCSPTTHPGSFRCSLHKNTSSGGGGHNQTASFPSTRLNMRRSAMANSIVRIGGVEGEWVKRALTTLIRPSSHQQKRRDSFHPRSSRLSIMSKAEEA